MIFKKTIPKPKVFMLPDKLLNERKDDFIIIMSFVFVQYVMILFSKNSPLVKMRCTLGILDQIKVCDLM